MGGGGTGGYKSLPPVHILPKSYFPVYSLPRSQSNFLFVIPSDSKSHFLKSGQTPEVPGWVLFEVASERNVSFSASARGTQPKIN